MWRLDDKACGRKMSQVSENIPLCLGGDSNPKLSKAPGITSAAVTLLSAILYSFSSEEIHEVPTNVGFLLLFTAIFFSDYNILVVLRTVDPARFLHIIGLFP